MKILLLVPLWAFPLFAQSTLNFKDVVRYDEELGWVGKPHVEGKLGTPPFHVTTNRYGFRDTDHFEKKRRRILFAGDSFVWGFGVDQAAMLTEQLRAQLSDWEILNQGMSGYGTDQSYLLLKRSLPKYQPDIIFLMFCTENDHLDNSTNRHAKYFKPYLRVSGKELRLDGVPVPHPEGWFFKITLVLLPEFLTRKKVSDPTLEILEATRKLVTEHHAELWIGLTHTDNIVEKYARAANLPVLNFAGAERFSYEGNHWTPSGNLEVATQIASRIRTLPPHRIADIP